MTIIVQVPTGNVTGQPTTLTLKDKIAKWLNRTDLGAQIPDFINMAESEISADKRLRSTFQVDTETGYITGGVVPFPTDLLEFQALYFNDEPLIQVSNHEFWRTRRRDVFTRLGEMCHIAGKPDGSYELVYVKRLPGLVMDSDSNWMLREHFDIYLYKCCEIGSIWLRDPEGAQGYRAKFEEAANKIGNSISWHKWGGASLAVEGYS